MTATVASAINVIAAKPVRERAARGGTPIKSELSHLFHRNRASSLLRPDVFQQGRNSHSMRLDAVISFL